MKHKKLLCVSLLTLFGAVSLASCSGGTQAKTIEGTYITSVIEDNSATGGFNYYRAYELELYTDSSYRLTNTEITYGYTMNLATTVVVNEGTLTKGTPVDGYTPLNLAAASKIILESYSLAGGYNISINSENVTYPAEIPAQTQGEKSYANSFEELQSKYGTAKTYYVGDNNILNLTDPNA